MHDSCRHPDYDECHHMVLMQVLHSFSITFVSGIQSTQLEIQVMDEGRGNLGYMMGMVADCWRKWTKYFFYLHIYKQMYLFVISSHYGLCSICLPRGSEFKKCWERKLSKKVHSTSFTAMKINKAVIYPLLQCSFVRSFHQYVGQQEHYSW